jgi:signal peptide peptidase SppA
MKIKIPFLKKPPLVPILRLNGVIGGAGRFSSGLTDAGLAPLIERAFTRGTPAAVALVINSPGGSPVQSSLIAARIRRLADEKKIPVHCFVEDVAASGGYWLAVAGDDIYVDASSIIGSIGVISQGFGFNELMERHGIERRVYTAGTSKSFGDPFLPKNPADEIKIKALQEPIHQAFIEHVKRRRAGRLAKADLFNADIWVGQKAVEMGLVDGLGHVVPKLKELYGHKVRLVPMGQKRSLMSRLGARALSSVMAELEQRALWARFGL